LHERRMISRMKEDIHSREWQSWSLRCLLVSNANTYVSKWVDSVRFRFGFCWVEFLPDWNRHSVDSIRFDSEFFRFRFKRQKIQKLLRLSWRCVVNKYIYMHLLYVACARYEKNFFCGNYRARS
jgi:hypothetical protein